MDGFPGLSGGKGDSGFPGSDGRPGNSGLDGELLCNVV